MVTKKHNLCVAVRKYTDQTGQEKSIWRTIGELTTFKTDKGTNTICELYHLPSVKISVFEQKKKETEKPQEQSSQLQDSKIDLTDIVF